MNTKVIDNVKVIDWTKPVETAEGVPVVVITTDARVSPGTNWPDESVLVYIGNSTIIYRVDSKTGITRALPVTIRNVPPPKKVMYVNVYKTDGGSLAYLSRQSADVGAAGGRCGCVRVEYAEGQFDD